MLRRFTIFILLVNAMHPMGASIIRDDVPDQQYLDLANNVGTFAVGADYPDFSPACFVEVGNEQGSGVLIAPQYVLTAAHVIWSELKDPIPGQTALKISFGPGPEGSFTEVVMSTAYVLHPAWVDLINSGKESEMALFSSGVDIALIRLERPITTITPAAWNQSTTETLGGTLFTCGFGYWGTGSLGKVVLDDKKRSIQNNADRILTELTVQIAGYENIRGGVIALDFDNPAMTTNTLEGLPGVNDDIDMGFLGVGTSVASPQALEGTPASGDSGGPWYMKLNGIWKVVGVESFGNEDEEFYGDISVSTRVANFTSWIVTEMWQPIWGTTSGAGNGWFWKYNAGFIYGVSSPWFYHETLGWCYPDGGILSGMWFYRIDDATWYFANESELPWAYNSGKGNWEYLFVPSA